MIQLFKFNKVKFCTLCLCVILYACGKPAQKEYKDYSQHSGINSIEVNERVVNNLEVLGKVWGYVKYHHPVFSKNLFNIDFELFDLIPQIVNCQSIEERNEILANWIDGFGHYKKMRRKDMINMDLSDSLCTKNLSIDWISDTLALGKNLSSKLLNLRHARRHDESQYVVFNSLGVPVFEGDNLYANNVLLDCGQKLLALFRYWNIIEYYFPYKYLVDNDWKGKLREYISVFITSFTYSDYFSACYRLSAEIDDTHALSDAFFRQKYGKNVLPIQMRFMEGRLVVTNILQKDSMHRSELCVGDEIIKIGKESLDNQMKHIRQHTSKSNETVFLSYASWNIGRTYENSTDVTFKRGCNNYIAQISTIGESIYFSILNSISMNQLAYEFIDESIGYIRPNKVNKSNVWALDAWLDSCKTVIVDLRKATNREFSALAHLKLTPNDTEFAIGTFPVKKYPGLFQPFVQKTVSYDGAKYEGQIVVLVDETTQSKSEWLTMLLQANPNVTVIGSQTAGADGDIAVVRLPGSVKLFFSSIGFYYPDGRETQRVGISIDKLITLTIQGLVAGKDELIEYALSIIKNEGTLTSY